MGRDTPLYACLEKHPKYEDGFKAAADLREMYEGDPEAKQVIDVAKGLEGPASPGRHPRRGGRHHSRAADRVPAHPAQARGGQQPGRRSDRHAVRDARRRRPRSAEDGLPGPAQPRRHRADASTSSRRPPATVPTSTTWRWTTRRCTRCSNGATPSGSSSSRARPVRALMRSLAPTSFDDISALIALYRPGPMAANMHNDYADRKNGRKPIEYLHPELEGLLGDTQGLMIYQESVHAGRAAFRRFHVGRGRRHPQGRRQEEPRRHGRTSASSSSPGARPRATGPTWARSSSTSSSPSPTTPSTRATPTATG